MFQFGFHLEAICVQKLYVFLKKWLPKIIPESRAVFVWFLCYCSDPGTLRFELSPTREHAFQFHAGAAFRIEKLSIWHPFGPRNHQDRRQGNHGGSRIGARASIVEPAALRAMEINGNQLEIGSIRGQSLCNRQVIWLDLLYTML